MLPLRSESAAETHIRYVRRASAKSRIEMAIDRSKVAIFDGDPVVREVLEVLLQATGYHPQFLGELAGDELIPLLADFHLLLVAPELSAERCNVLLDMMSNPAMPAKIPILELLSEDREQNVRGARIVLWPCSAEELERAIEAALFAQR